jgi:beta-glucosidase
MTDWKEVKAIVYNWYPGQIGNVALAEVLSGKTNPSGKLPMTIEIEFSDSPAYGYVPGGTAFMCDHPHYFDLDASRDVINRWSQDIGIKEAPEHLYDVNYVEDVLVGYRWYDTKNIEALFPFGFGLSYTSFEIKDVELSATEIAENQTLSLNIHLHNSGKLKGATVVQVYVGEKNPSITRPVKELKAFRKVMLNAGESKVIELELDARAFAFWNPDTKSWTVNKGAFDMYIGESSQQISAIKTVEIQ